MSERLGTYTRQIVSARAKGTPLVRAVIARLVAAAVKTKNAYQVMQEYYSGDNDAMFVLRAAISLSEERNALLEQRAATSPASTTGWGSELAALSVANFISSLGPQSAGASLLLRGMQFTFENAAMQISVPSPPASADRVGFVGQGQAIPTHQPEIAGGKVLKVNKFGTIVAFNREPLLYTQPNVEELVRQVLAESVALSLDKAMFDDNAASALRPAGLRKDINTTVAAEEQSTLQGTVIKDVQTLAAAVSTVAGSSPICLVASPAQAIALRLYLGRDSGFEIFPSNSLSAGIVVAIASNCIASACDPLPRFDVSDTATLHQATDAHDNIDSAAVGENTISMWQTDRVALRLIMEVSWCLRDPAGLAWTTVMW